MTARSPNFDEIYKCEAEIWHSLACTVRVSCEFWRGSEVTREALKRVLRVMEEQTRRAGGGKDEG